MNDKNVQLIPESDLLELGPTYFELTTVAVNVVIPAPKNGQKPEVLQQQALIKALETLNNKTNKRMSNEPGWAPLGPAYFMGAVICRDLYRGARNATYGEEPNG